MKFREVWIYNSYTRRKELFTPIHEGRVGMYVCGPTVYGDPHLGHARSAITFDVIFRYFKHLGYKVRYVRNITDVGHLEDDVNEGGEDKILKKARLEQLEPMEVAQHYTNVYRKAMRELNVLEPSIEPTATGHIPEQISIIQKCLDNGWAYEVNGSVYFDVVNYAKKFPYGELSGRVLDELLAGSRELEGQEEKRNPADFALWKKAEPQHLMQWDSPWGRGFPGWHIECTAMSAKYLGLPFDIHGGGMDLKFPHHEAEIAQSYGCCNIAPVKYWIHNNMVTLDGQKMAKSKGNFITLEEMFTGSHPLLERAYSPMVVRFFMLQAHYGSPLDFSNKALSAAESALSRLLDTLELSDKLHPTSDKTSDFTLEQKMKDLQEECYHRMSDDFNTAETLAVLFEMSSILNSFFHGTEDMNGVSKTTVQNFINTYRSFVVDILGLRLEKRSSDKLDAVMQVLLELRKEAKKDRNFALSDAIRDKLSEKGIQIMDFKDGSMGYKVVD